jgi:hypothetical protein
MGVDRIPLYVSDSMLPLQGEEFVRLDPAQLEIIDAVMRTSVPVRASFETLARHIFGAGIEVVKPGFTVTNHVHALLNGPWLRFCRDVMLYMFAYGFVFVRLRDDQVPIAVNPLEFDITVVRKPNGNRLYRLMDRPHAARVWPTRIRKPVDDVLVWEKNAPDLYGRLTSVVPVLLQTNSFLNLMLSCAAKAEVRRAMPVLFLEHVPESPEARALAMDIGVPGNNNMMHADAIEREAGFDVERIQENEARIRHANVMANGGSALLEDEDPVNGQLRYPLDPNGLPYVNIPVPIPQHRRIATHTQSESPAFLTELMKLHESDVARITGVPASMFDSSRSSIATNITAMNIFYATQQDHRMMLTIIVTALLRIVYGEDNMEHMLTQYDSALDWHQNVEKNDFQVSFPGLLDPEILNMFQDRGAMHWDVWRTYVARYYGAPRNHLASCQLDVATDRPLADIQAEEKAFELKLKTTGTAPGGGGGGGGKGVKRKAPSSGGGVKVAASEKANATRKQNAKALGKRTKRPGSSLPEVPRGADVSS